jgi:hypothetical protein
LRELLLFQDPVGPDLLIEEEVLVCLVELLLGMAGLAEVAYELADRDRP